MVKAAGAAHTQRTANNPGTQCTRFPNSFQLLCSIMSCRSPRDPEAAAGGRAGGGEEEGFGLGAALGALRQLPPQLGRHLGHQHAPGPHGEGENSSGQYLDVSSSTFQCKPLHCELCGCQATSPIQAKMHYEGKTHDKGVRAFFVNWSGNTTKIVPQKLVSSEKKPKPSPVNIYSMNKAHDI